MGLLRQTPPEYRALVVENEREFRTDLIYTIESMDLGISVVAEASDYEDALELLETQEIDLLVTDINLTDEPQFRVGVRDGTQLASIARERFDIPSIFLTAFADYDSEVVIRATASDPIGFIQKHGTEVGTQIQHLIRLAMRHLELLRGEREGRQQLEAVVNQLGEALLFVDGDGRVLDLNDGASKLLGYSGEELLDQHWDDVLQVETTSSTTDMRLAQLINRGTPGQLSFVALKLRSGESKVFSVQASPSEHLREPCTLLLLRAQKEEMDDLAALKIETGSSILIISLRDDASGGRSNQNRITMLELRSLLVSRVRAGDAVSRTRNTIIAVLMPETDEVTAFALARSLVASTEQQLSINHPNIALNAGLAHRADKQSANATVASAFSALDQAIASNVHKVVAANTESEITVPGPPGNRRALSRLRLGFEITASILDIPPEHVSDLAALEAVITEILVDSQGLAGFCLAEVSSDRRCAWRSPKAVSSDKEALGTLDQARLLFPENLLNDQYSALVPIEFTRTSNVGYALLPLNHNGKTIGLAALILSSSAKDSAKEATGAESKLAVIAGQHMGGLFARATAVRSEDSAARVAHETYNLYNLTATSREVSAIARLFDFDTPIALVGEPGMARIDLLEQAASLSNSLRKNSAVIIHGRDWRQDEQLQDFAETLLSCHDRLLVVNDPQRLAPALQRMLGRAMRTRTIEGNSGGEQLLPLMRFSVTVPHSPAKMSADGYFNLDLASALGAGVVEIPALRTLGHSLLDWADAILEAESNLCKRGNLEFDLGAKAAIRNHPWPGNLIEMQGRIRSALERSSRASLTEMDLGLFQLYSVDNAVPETNDQYADSGLQRVRRALAEVIEIGCNLGTPPPLGVWVEDEFVGYSVERYRGHPDPIGRSATFLGIEKLAIEDLSLRAKNSENGRIHLEYWQSTRLAIRGWLDGSSGFETDFRAILGPLVAEPLNNFRPELALDRKQLIAGESLSHYLMTE